MQLLGRLGQQALEHGVPVHGAQQGVVVATAAGLVDLVVRPAGGRGELEPGGAGDLAPDARLDLRIDPVVLIDERHVPTPSSSLTSMVRAPTDTRGTTRERARRRSRRTCGTDISAGYARDGL